MHEFSDAGSLIRALAPEAPVVCLRPHVAYARAREFVDRFPGDVLYAVKANPEPAVLRTLWDAGVRSFDVASLQEIALVRETLPEARLAYMHPVKSRGAIRRAWHEFGVRTFAVDHAAELDKIVDELGPSPEGLTIVVRLAVPDGDSGICLAGKFGVSPKDAPGLLLAARAVSTRLGVSFHVGSQAHDPRAYERAMAIASDAIVEAGVVVDIVDVGGGFPVAYPDRNPPPLEAYIAAVERGFETMPVGAHCELWAEPGRRLVAECASLLVRVDLRKGDALYINDGTYGSLFDAGMPGFVYPIRHHRPGGAPSDAELVPVSFYGPTCDGIDHMPGPFHVPGDTDEGDWLEIGNLGAYAISLRTAFNGFGHVELAVVQDHPFRGIAAPPAIAERAEVQS